VERARRTRGTPQDGNDDATGSGRDTGAPRRDGDADERAELLGQFARHLRRYRTAAGFTQDRLAAKVGRGRLYLVKLEGAQREPSW
jgi:ribosome-binding protein aMBF1 (putative translation factor)